MALIPSAIPLLFLVFCSFMLSLVPKSKRFNDAIRLHFLTIYASFVIFPSPTARGCVPPSPARPSAIWAAPAHVRDAAGHVITAVRQ